MLTLSDLIWTGRRWEVRTAAGFVGLDDLLEERREQIDRVTEDNETLRTVICVFCHENAKMQGMISGCASCRYKPD